MPAAISSALTDIGTFEGLRISQMLCKVVKKLDEATDPNVMIVDSSGAEFESDNENGHDLEEESENEIENESENEAFGGWSPQSPGHHVHTANGTTRAGSRDLPATRALNSRIRQDLRSAKEAGFRVGQLGVIFDNNPDAFVTISCRVAKLGISEEALQAWHLDPTQYFILLIRYTSGYRTLERLTAEEAWGQKTVEMRVGLSQTYKIKTSEAISAFSQNKGKHSEKEVGIYDNSKPSAGLIPLFIGRPLDELLNDRLPTLLRYRLDKAFSWDGAEEFYNDNQGCNSISDAIHPKYWEVNQAKIAKSLPPLVTADHMAQPSGQLSFPLLTMQFALRHLVRCTEFCLVCHCKVEEDFEALKPYVCSKPLCLYQYMALGFGPSIEHEITSQPHVVDLLVSFCYSSASARKLSSLPLGMGLAVPPPYLMPHSTRNYTGFSKIFNQLPSLLDPSLSDGAFPAPKDSKSDNKTMKSFIHKAKFDRAHMELIFPPGDRTLRAGHWIFLTVPGIYEEQWHCRVIEALHPTVRLGAPIVRSSPGAERSEQGTSVSVRDSRNTDDIADQPDQPPNSNRTNFGSAGLAITPAATPPSPLFPESSSLPEAEFIIYDQNFDDLTDEEKQSSICNLLMTLPSVLEMKAFLNSKNGKNATLRAWADRISPAALGVLRWIIASNRSCIIQVDSMEGDSKHSEERVSGMSQWMQFRFAQGAPDKEQRFVTSVRQMTNKSNYPTLFAWHGSPLHNWHGIVREGLHFQHTAHGRAFGNGVYHALDVATSLGYSCGFGRIHYGSDMSTGIGEWPHSQLKISEAIALNEIVNAPDQFVSKSPHLVIAQLDWIQSRYLFVRCNLPGQTIQDKPPTQEYKQDPSWTPVGSNREKIIIPITAVSKSRRPGSKIVKTGNKKVKVTNKHAEWEFEDLIFLSDDTDIDDISMLLSEDEDTSVKPGQNKGKRKHLDVPTAGRSSQTDFIAGVLDHTTLPLLEPPSYATSMATRALQRELTNTLQVQETHPAHELGWYIDPNHVSNVYQWIVELHSFEPQLPLANDLKAKGLKSVVLEIRFGKEYPISPPFVRVIRPRFLSFMAGGGGHITAGGALCMELLTNSGWSAVSNIESVLLQVRLAISSTDPKPARLEPGNVRDYGVREAVEAFVRACNAHGVSSKSYILCPLGEITFC